MFCGRGKKGRYGAAPRPGFRGFRRFTGFRGGWWRLTPQIIKKAGPRPPSFRPKRSGVEKSPPSDGTGSITREISRLRVSSKRFPSAPYRHTAPLEMTMLASAPPVISTEAKRSGEISFLPWYMKHGGRKSLGSEYHRSVFHLPHTDTQPRSR